MPVKQAPNIYEELRRRLRSARQVFVLTGAGVPADCGVRTVCGWRELHGNVGRAGCLGCGWTEDIRGLEADERPPVCRACGEAMRPDVVLFGELLPAGIFERAAERASVCDLCFVVGTSAIVYPA